VPAIEFPYTIHKGYLLPIIPISIESHRLWVFVDSGATFSILAAAEAARIGIDLNRGRFQMIVVGDGSFIPVYLHDLPIQIGEWQITAPIGFSERLGVGFNLMGRTGIFDQFQICFNDRARLITLHKL
jgi:hypothetical protein